MQRPAARLLSGADEPEVRLHVCFILGDRPAAEILGLRIELSSYDLFAVHLFTPEISGKRTYELFREAELLETLGSSPDVPASRTQSIRSWIAT